MSKREEAELTPEQIAELDELIEHMFDPGCAKATLLFHLIKWDILTEVDGVALMVSTAHEEARRHADWCFVHRLALVH